MDGFSLGKKRLKVAHKKERGPEGDGGNGGGPPMHGGGGMMMGGGGYSHPQHHEPSPVRRAGCGDPNVAGVCSEHLWLR